MEKKSNWTLHVIVCLLPLVLVSTNVAANIHGIESLYIVATDDPPEYNLDQIEGEVADTIRVTKRRYWIQAALLGGGGHAENDCPSAPPQFALADLLCDVSYAIGVTVEESARRVQVDQARDDLAGVQVDTDPGLAPELAANVDELLSSNLLQLELATALEDFVIRETRIAVVDDGSEVVPGHRLATNLLRVDAVSNKLDSRIAIRLHGEAVLTSNRDGAIVDRYNYAVETPKHFIEGWSEGGIGLLAASVDEGIARMAEILAEEVLLVVTSPHQRGRGYLVKPIAPKYKRTLRGDAFISVAGDYRPTETLQPTFSWEDFRDAYAKDPLYADLEASELEVSYDMRIYRSRPSSPANKALLVASELIYEFRDISGEEFTPDVMFEPCTPYSWTIRARFVGDKNTHVTYWSGAYKEKNVEEFRQHRVSEAAGVRTARSIGSFMRLDLNEMWREEAQYFPFLATLPDQKCSKEEIRAAMDEKAH